MSDARQSNKVWYILPILLGFIGGIIMYFMVKEFDKQLAKKGLLLGFLLSILGFVLMATLTLVFPFMMI